MTSLQDRFINPNQTVEEPEKKEELANNLLGYIGGTGLEVGAGYGTDLATAGLLHPATIAATGGWSIAGYGIANFASGAASNWAAQKLRGEEEISWGELISSGLIDIIPFFGQRLKGITGATKAAGIRQGLKNVGGTAIESGVRAVAQRQGEEAIDEQRWLTPRETLEAAAVGGAFGGTLRGTGEGYNYYKARFKKYDLQEADKLFPPDAVQELVKQGRIRHEGKPVNKNFQAAILHAIDGEDPSRNYPFVLSHEDTYSHIRRNPFTGAVEQHPDLVKPVTRPKAAKVSGMGQEGGGGGPLDFKRLTTEAQQELARKVPQDAERITLKAGNPYSPHHVWPLKTMPSAVDYLDDEGMTMSLNFLRKGLGDVKFGDVQKPYMAYGALHDKLHDFMRLELGDNWNLVKVLEVKHFDGKRLSDGIGIQERMKPGGFYEDVVKVLKEQERIIKIFQTALEGQAHFDESTAEEFIKRVAAKAKLNEKFKEITSKLIERSTSANPKGGRAPYADVKQIIDEIVGATDDELRSAVIQKKTSPPRSPKSKAADKVIWNKFQSYALEVLNIKGLSLEDQHARILSYLEEYKLLDPTTPEEGIEIMLDKLVFEIERAGIKKLPPEKWREILAWEGREI